MGMTNGQVLWRIELPLALPVILTGIRVVLVQNIGMVTVAALIGGGGLGTFVFQGIGQTAIDLVLLGAIPIVVLAFSAAVLLDALVEVLDRAQTMITIENLTKQYGATNVVDDVSMQIAGNSITVIVGTSGSGKSTLLRMINRLVEPSAGRVLIEGKDTRAEPAHLLRRRIGYAIQGHGLFPHRTVAENIATVPQLLRWSAQRVRDAGRGAAAACSSWTRRQYARAFPARALRRPAAARRRGAGAGGRARRAADGRAVRRARSDHPRQGAGGPACRSSGASARPSCSSPTTWTRPSTSGTAWP